MKSSRCWWLRTRNLVTSHKFQSQSDTSYIFTTSLILNYSSRQFGKCYKTSGCQLSHFGCIGDCIGCHFKPCLTVHPSRQGNISTLLCTMVTALLWCLVHYFVVEMGGTRKRDISMPLCAVVMALLWCLVDYFVHRRDWWDKEESDRVLRMLQDTVRSQLRPCCTWTGILNSCFLHKFIIEQFLLVPS